MNEKDAYRYLEKMFVATFLDELMPGIFHNFANPLNGIMGRSKLMQRRLVEFIEKIRMHYPDMDADMGERCKKLLSDINAIADESEKFYDLFRISTGKLYAISAHNMDRLNLSSLIEAEMGFADFYLDFKHNVRKDIRIDHEMPDVSGITAHYSMALWALIRQSAKNCRDANDQTFMITTDHDDRWVSVTINNIDDRLWQGWPDVLSDTIISGVKLQDVPNEQKDLFYALLLLIKSSAGLEITHDGNAKTLTVSIPHHLKKKGVG